MGGGRAEQGPRIHLMHPESRGREENTAREREGAAKRFCFGCRFHIPDPVAPQTLQVVVGSPKA